MQASPSPADEVVDLREYVAVLRRRIWLILGVTIVFAGLAGAYSFTRTPMYTARATVLVQPETSSSQFRPDQLVSLDTEARIAKSAPVAQIALDEQGSGVPLLEFLKRVDVQTTPDTLVLDIFFTDTDPQRAADGANAVAAAYLEYKRQRSIDAAAAERQGITQQIDELTQERTKLDRELAGLSPGTTEYEDAQRERDAVNGQIAVLTAELAGVTPSSGAGVIIGPAFPPQKPSSPKHVVNLAMGLLLGGFLGVVFAFIRDRTDERISGRTDLDVTLDAPVLAAIPKVAGWNKKGPVWLVTEQQPRSPAAEAYRTLRTGVMAMARQRDLKVFGITSPMLGEGKTTTTANLGATLSHADKRVLVISGDLRRPSLYRYFNLHNDIGLADVLLGEVPLEEAVDHVSQNLSVLTSGRPPVRPAELLQSHRMAEVIERTRERYDFVLVDCPPVAGLADTLAIAPFVDAIIMVASAEQSKRGAIIHAVDQLGQVGATVRAGVLNMVALSKRKGTYGYGYGYGYGGEDDQKGSTKTSPAPPTSITPSPDGAENGASRSQQARTIEVVDPGMDPGEIPSMPPEQAGARSDQ
jgi:capsular exopolysaccharide synthesis family protein